MQQLDARLFLVTYTAVFQSGYVVTATIVTLQGSSVGGTVGLGSWGVKHGCQSHAQLVNINRLEIITYGRGAMDM